MSDAKSVVGKLIAYAETRDALEELYNYLHENGIPPAILRMDGQEIAELVYNAIQKQVGG